MRSFVFSVSCFGWALGQTTVFDHKVFHVAMAHSAEAKRCFHETDLHYFDGTISAGGGDVNVTCKRNLFHPCPASAYT
jgi:hypothetical protein